MTEDAKDSRTRQQDAVLVCLAASDSPQTTSSIIATFAKVGSSRRFTQPELDELLKGLKGDGLVEEPGDGVFRITGNGRTALGPLAERPLSEI